MRYLIFIFIFCTVLTGCGPHNEDSWEDTGILRVGTDATYPPFEIVNTNTRKVEGFDIDVMNRICELSNLEAKYIITPFDGIISGLKGYKYDCIISAMTITPQRDAIVNFTEPYYDAGQILAVPKEDTTIHGIEDLRGKLVGVQLGTTGEKYAKSLSGVTVVPYENIGAAFIDMEDHRVDAVLNDYPTTMEYIHLQGKAKTVGKVLSEEHYGIAVREGDKALLDTLNVAIDKMKANGDFEKIKEKWFRVDTTGNSDTVSTE